MSRGGFTKILSLDFVLARLGKACQLALRTLRDAAERHMPVFLMPIDRSRGVPSKPLTAISEEVIIHGLSLCNCRSPRVQPRGGQHVRLHVAKKGRDVRRLASARKRHILNCVIG